MKPKLSDMFTSSCISSVPFAFILGHPCAGVGLLALGLLCYSWDQWRIR